MCGHMGIRHAKTLAYHSRSNGRAEVAGRQMFEKFRQLHIDEPGRNWYNSLWRVPQAYHDLPGPTGLSPHCILFLRDRVSRTLPWLNHGKVARDAKAMVESRQEGGEGTDRQGEKENEGGSGAKDWKTGAQLSLRDRNTRRHEAESGQAQGARAGATGARERSEVRDKWTQMGAKRT